MEPQRVFRKGCEDDNGNRKIWRNGLVGFHNSVAKIQEAKLRHQGGPLGMGSALH